MATLNLQVAASTDDAWYGQEEPRWELTLNRGYAGSQGAAYDRNGFGMRFQNVTIPKGATITTAYLTFKANTYLSADTCKTRISAEAVNDAPTFADDAAAFDARAANHTTAQVDWDAIGPWTAETNYNSPEIKTVIQEIVNRAGWASGNGLVIFWDDFDERSTVEAFRGAWSYDHGSDAPKLHIEYTVQYDETGKLQVILAAQGKTDIQTMLETAKLQVVLAAQGKTDTMLLPELGKLQVVLAAQGEFDSYAYNELGLLQVMLAAQGEAESLTLGELGREQVLLAVLGEADIQTMLETAKLQVVLAAQGITATQAMLETAKLQVLLAAQGETEHLALGELGREQVILAVLGEADQYGFIETGKLQVILAQIGISTVWNIRRVRLQGAVRNLPSVRELEAL